MSETQAEYDTIHGNLVLATLCSGDALIAIKRAIEYLKYKRPEVEYRYWAEHNLLYHHLTDVYSELEELIIFARKHFMEEN